ncbi:hypothetical protein [Varunaivibrio sulfuroxidans]|uniref:hypothetical protein n=1 Tax=Varunaivibrio sulfuroxidans TaxID=1773489 RepID=UPI00104CD5A2|nr:hypothetical protein [Varunaivibrio sulfuroxidans]WES31245.1 hypothetical protein P3M64_02400 [Varunaivibrio sulfuroxidans]
MMLFDVLVPSKDYDLLSRRKAEFLEECFAKSNIPTDWFLRPVGMSPCAMAFLNAFDLLKTQPPVRPKSHFHGQRISFVLWAYLMPSIWRDLGTHLRGAVFFTLYRKGKTRLISLPAPQAGGEGIVMRPQDIEWDAFDEPWLMSLKGKHSLLQKVELLPITR